MDDEIRKASGEEVLEDESVTAATGSSVHKLVTADGTYATQSAFSTAGDKAKKQAEKPPLRKYLMEGDFFIGAAIGSTMTKLALRYSAAVQDEKKQNRFNAECMLVMTSILHLGVSGLPEKKMTKDDADRLNLCLKVPYLVPYRTDSAWKAVTSIFSATFQGAVQFGRLSRYRYPGNF